MDRAEYTRRKRATTACSPGPSWAALSPKPVGVGEPRRGGGYVLDVLEDLKAFDISPQWGFLPDDDPTSELPARFGTWEQLARQLPKLLLTGRVRGLIETLPPAPFEALEPDGELRRAMQILSYLGHAYVWGGDPPAQRIPESVAVP